jgi:hypothetical protein
MCKTKCSNLNTLELCKEWDKIFIRMDSVIKKHEKEIVYDEFYQEVSVCGDHHCG